VEALNQSRRLHPSERRLSWEPGDASARCGVAQRGVRGGGRVAVPHV